MLKLCGTLTAMRYRSHFLGLLQICSEKMTTSLDCNALVAHSVDVLRLNFNAKQRKYLIDHGHNLLGFLSVGGKEMEIEGGHAELDKDISRYGFTSWEVVLLVTVISQTSSSSSREERASALCRAKLPLCKPLRKDTETGIEVT